MKIRLIESSETNPFLNLSIEHALLDLSADKREDIVIRFWRNTPSVIIGRTQDISVEVDLQYCENENIPVLRRISGGGTVYHDLGNLNTTIVFPLNLIPGKIDVQNASTYITNLMVRNLKNLGFNNIELEGDTNIFFNKNKISGSAGHLKRGWFLHHATLLLRTDLITLNKTILARESFPDDNRKSRYFPTVNLVSLTEKDWIDSFVSLVAENFDLEVVKSDLLNNELNFAKKLKYNLYQNADWVMNGKRKLVKAD